MTVYNRDAYLSDAIESVIASSYTNWELIIVDDCSSDDSLQIANDYAEKDERIRVFCNKENMGDYPNRMRAASYATGRYIKYLDSDDLIYPHGLQVMVEAMDQHSDSALGLSHSLREDVKPYPWMLSPEKAYHKQFLGAGCLSSGPSGAIIRKDAFEDIGGFHNWGVASDMDLWLRMAARWPVVLLPPGLIWWRVHEGQEYRSAGADQSYLEAGFRLCLEALTSINCPLNDTDRERAVNRLNQHHARHILALALKSGQFNMARLLFRVSTLNWYELLRGFRPYQ